MKEKGKIIKIKKEEAVVRVARKSACAGCGMCAFKPSDLYVDISLQNTLNGKVGDEVFVDITSGNVAKMSLAAYLLPLVPAVLLLVLGVKLLLPDWASLIMFFAGMAVGFAVVAVVDKKIYRKSKNLPKMTAFCDTNEQNTTEEIQDLSNNQ